MRRHIAAGVLVGIVIGILATFLFSGVLEDEFLVNRMTQEQAPGNSSIAPFSSPLKVGFALPALFSLIGATFGFILWKLKKII